MFEKQHQPLLPLSKFVRRLTYSVCVGLFFIAIALYIGMMGYRTFEDRTWVDAFADASMILSGMGPLHPLATKAGKIFAGCYALFSGLTFIFFISVIFAPVIHRFLHKFHVQESDSSD